jgi:hypothetical protein
MSIRPFLSATKDDLDQDCRPGVINAVRLAINAEPITMETWPAAYDEAVKVCREKLDESTHYIGIFAYRRGWVPVSLQKSITEAEFDWAVELKKKMAAFLPDPKSDFARELKARTEGQGQADADAQDAFRQRVMQNAYEPFVNAMDLVGRVMRRLHLWSQGGVIGIARQAARAGPRVPSPADLEQLGRKDQSRQLQDSLEIIIGSGFSNVICFLVSGLNDYGQTQLVSRLRKELENKSQAHQYKISLGPLWIKKTSLSLIQQIGSSIQSGWVPTSIQDLAERLKDILEDSDVVLEIDRIDRFQGSVATFVNEVWQPLTTALDQALPHRLTMLVTVEGPLSPEFDQYLQPPLEQNATAFDARRLVQLPELQPFTEMEVTTWLRVDKWVANEVAPLLAQSLISETKGIPQLLYLKLSDEATWNY